MPSHSASCAMRSDVRLITVDPLQAYLPSQVNAWKGQDVRLALEPIRQVAAERSIAVVLIQHQTEGLTANRWRGLQSQGIPQIARSVMIWDRTIRPCRRSRYCEGADTGEGQPRSELQSERHVHDHREDSHGKPDGAGTVRGADAEITPDDVIADHETRTARDEAVEWLCDLLSDGPVAAKDVQRQAREDGIAERTLKRAKINARVVSEASRDDSGISGWIWRSRTQITQITIHIPIALLALLALLAL